MYLRDWIREVTLSVFVGHVDGRYHCCKVESVRKGSRILTSISTDGAGNERCPWFCLHDYQCKDCEFANVV
jgi:hypothetical protein